MGPMHVHVDSRRSTLEREGTLHLQHPHPRKAHTHVRLMGLCLENFLAPLCRAPTASHTCGRVWEGMPVCLRRAKVGGAATTG